MPAEKKCGTCDNTQENEEQNPLNTDIIRNAELGYPITDDSHDSQFLSGLWNLFTEEKRGRVPLESPLQKWYLGWGSAGKRWGIPGRRKRDISGLGYTFI